MNTTIKPLLTFDVSVKLQYVIDLLITGREGGYAREWIRKITADAPWDTVEGAAELRSLQEQFDLDPPIPLLYYAPFMTGGSWQLDTIDTDDGRLDVHKITLETMRTGLQVMAEKYPKQFASIFSENTDAITGDVFLQCCVFGDAIYD